MPVPHENVPEHLPSSELADNVDLAKALHLLAKLGGSDLYEVPPSLVPVVGEGLETASQEQLDKALSYLKLKNVLKQERKHKITTKIRSLVAECASQLNFASIMMNAWTSKFKGADNTRLGQLLEPEIASQLRVGLKNAKFLL